MPIGGVAAHDGVSDILHREIGEQGHARETDRARESDGGASKGFHGRRVSHGEINRAEKFLYFDFVHDVVAAHQDGHGLAVSQIEKGLDQLRSGHVQEGGHVLDSFFAGRGHQAFFSDVVARSLRNRLNLRAFNIRGVVAGIADCNAFFARLGEDHEFMRRGSAD